MKRSVIRNTVSLVFLAPMLLTACAHLPFFKKHKQTGYEIHLEQDSYVKIGNQKAIFKQQGQTLFVQNLPVWVEAPGYVSALLVAQPAAKTQKIDVQLKPQNTWSGEVFNQKLTSSVTDIVSNVTHIQKLLFQSHAHQAYTKLQELRTKYPDVRWLGFLQSSCLLVLGKTAEARSVLETTLQEYPNDPAGKALKKILFGAK